MSENIEFIPASSLPEAEGDEVSVLCLENGEMKQKPGESLGGGVDAVIEATPNGSGFIPFAELLSGSYDEIKSKLESGTMPNIIVKFSEISVTGISKCQSVLFLEDTYQIVCVAICANNMFAYHIASDGSVTIGGT